MTICANISSGGNIKPMGGIGSSLHFFCNNSSIQFNVVRLKIHESAKTNITDPLKKTNFSMDKIRVIRD